MPIQQVFAAYDATDKPQPKYYKYCPVCGTRLKLESEGNQRRPVCSNCGFVQFRNPFPGVVVVIEKEGLVLLGRRAGGFGKGKWGLPQGYIEFEEDFLTAAIREVKEETGLDVKIRSVINVVSNFLSPRLHTLAIVMLAGVIGGEPCACDDLEILEWFPLTEPLPEMAFEADRMILRRVQDTDLGEGLPVDLDFAK